MMGVLGELSDDVVGYILRPGPSLTWPCPSLASLLACCIQPFHSPSLLLWFCAVVPSALTRRCEQSQVKVIMGHYAGGGGAAPHEGMSAASYLATRFTTLKPPMLPVPNPWKLVRMLSAQQWTFFALAFSAWVRWIRFIRDFGE